MTRSKPAKASPHRERAIPVQVYLSRREHSLLLKLAGKKRASVAMLVRDWIVAAAAARGLGADDRQASSPPVSSTRP